MTRRLRATARLVLVGSVIAYRALFGWTTPSMFVGTLLVGPLLQLLFFVHLGRSLGSPGVDFLVAGNAVLATSIAGVFGGAMAIANERRYGTLEAVLLSPRSRAAIFVARGLPYALNGLLASAVVLGAAALVLDWRVPAGSLPLIGAALLAASAASTAFGLVLGAVGLRIRDMWLIANLWSALLLLLTRTNVPGSALPRWLREVGDVLPLTHAADAVRGLAAGGPPGRALGLIGVELLVAVGYGLLALLLMRVFEAEGRRSAAFSTL